MSFPGPCASGDGADDLGRAATASGPALPCCAGRDEQQILVEHLVGQNAAVDDARRATLDAATRCFRQLGVRRATMVDIGREAGVTRQTVHNHFPGGKAAVIAEVIVEEARRVNARARRKLDLDRDPADVLADALVELVWSARRSPLVEVLIAGGALTSTSSVIERSPEVAAVMRDYWSPILEALDARGGLRPGLEHAEVIEWLTFVHVALVARPDAFGGDRERTRARLGRWVVPLLTGSFDT